MNEQPDKTMPSWLAYCILLCLTTVVVALSDLYARVHG